MISRERIKWSQLEPSCTKLLSCVQSVSTNICTYHLNSPNLEHEVLVNWVSQEIPTCNIISCPFETIFVWTKCWTSSQYKRTKADTFQILMSGICFHHSVKSMNICFTNISIMSIIHRNSIALNTIGSWTIWNVMSIIKYLLTFGKDTWSITEIRNLIHI